MFTADGDIAFDGFGADAQRTIDVKEMVQEQGAEHFSFYKVKDVCIESLGHVVTLPKNRNPKLLVTTDAKQGTSFRGQLALLKDEMISIAKLLSA